MKMRKLIALTLALTMLAGAFGVAASADDSAVAETPAATQDAPAATVEPPVTQEPVEEEPATPSIDLSQITPDQPETGEASSYQHMTYESEEHKLATMTKMMSNDRYDFYIHLQNGDVAVVDKVSGQRWFSTPYDYNTGSTSKDVKARMLSQLVIKYYDNINQKTLYSFSEAAQKNQIKIFSVSTGVRVEYTFGRAEQRLLLPIRIPKESMEENILSKLDAKAAKAFKNAYKLYDLSTVTNEKVREEYEKTYGITEDNPLYILVGNTANRIKLQLEGYIKAQTDYDFDQLEKDHAAAEFTVTNTVQPVFKMALEYSLTDDGMQVRLSTRSIRYNQTAFKLDSIDILPFFGAQKSTSEGYLFLPDGSGAIINYNTGDKLSNVLSGTIYGTDYGFNQTTGVMVAENYRMPVFGNYKAPGWGVLGVVTAGDSMSTVYAEVAGVSHQYNTSYASFYYRVKDKFTAMAGFEQMYGGSNTMEIYSKAKFTGDYKVRYFLLNDEDADYSGMAKTYREYLLDNGLLNKSEIDGTKDVPLYVESFGVLQARERVLGIPVTVKNAMTSFEDAQEMLNTLKDKGITNVNLRYQGWINGGMYYRINDNISIESKLGGKKGFKELIKYAEDNDIGLYPEVDVMYVLADGWFDGFSLRKHAAKLMDTSSAAYRKMYVATMSYDYSWKGLISPKYYMDIYEKAMKDYLDYNVGGISMGNLGDQISSDFNKKNVIFREESKEYIIETLAKAKEQNGSLLVTGGNVYAAPYADHIINMPVENSGFIIEDESIPFMQMVYHGYISYAGKTLNLSGDYTKMVLKNIETGSYPYFALSMQRNDLVKDSFLFASYFSVMFDQWLGDVTETYEMINDALKGFQTEQMVRHEKVADGVYKTAYSGGGYTLVNYNETDVTVDGTKVPALGYAVVH